MKKASSKPQSPAKQKSFALKRGHILGLRTNPTTMLAYGGFQWPRSGSVEAPDWKPTKECGNGLHFLPWGEGDADLLHAPGDANTQWLIISTLEKEVVDLKGKSKCRACEVVFCGDKEGAIKMLMAHAPVGTRINYGTATAGDEGTATAGNEGVISIRYFDSKADRYKVLFGYIGDDGLKPGVAYRLNAQCQFEEVQP